MDGSLRTEVHTVASVMDFRAFMRMYEFANFVIERAGEVLAPSRVSAGSAAGIICDIPPLRYV